MQARDPDHDPEWDIDNGIPAAELERKLAAHPEAKGVLIVSPTYYGVTADVAALAAVCHRHGVPLAVDEAWGPHFAFHPEMPPPPSAAAPTWRSAASTRPWRGCRAPPSCC